MSVAGNMYIHNKFSQWMVEYLCLKDKGLFNIWTPKVDGITNQIAKEVLAKAD